MSTNQQELINNTFITETDLEHLQIILNNLKSPNINTFNAMCWRLENLNIDFQPILSLKTTHSIWYQSTGTDLVWLSKVLLLLSIGENKSTSLVRKKFNSLIKTFYYLADRNQLQVRQDDLQEYITFLLMNDLNEGIPTQRLTPLTYESYLRGISIRTWCQIQKIYQLPKVGFKSNFSDAAILKALKNSIEILSSDELTFRDWKEGGSFNFLTLDFGKYYVEHAATFFERHINTAIALNRTIKNGIQITHKAGLSPNAINLKKTFMPIIGHFLSGKSLNDLKPSYKRNRSIRSQLSSIRDITLNTLRDNLRPLRVLETLVNEESIKELAIATGINTLDQNQREWLKYITEIRWAELNQDYGITQKKLKKLEHDCLMQIIGSEIDLEKINKLISKNYYHLNKNLEIVLPDTEFFDSLGIEDGKRRYRNIHKFISLVEAAGIIQFVAYTGWRESEYGFTLKDIKLQPNFDLLDQYACPIRYEIHGVAPKTNGKTKLGREITRPSYMCTLKLSELSNPSNESPCLYSFIASAKNPNDSGTFITKSIGVFWNTFLVSYEPFKKLALLDELNLLKMKTSLDKSDKILFTKLSERYLEEEWDKLENDALLREAYRRIKLEFLRVTFFLNDASRKCFIWKYRMGTLNKTDTQLLDRFLSDETKNVIKRLTSAKEVTRTLTKAVTNELLTDCIYPTPHSFRHMWAESVYRRFDGDIGWMIRSNFKHISQNMWLSYIRNKDNRRQHDRVKRQVVSSLLSNYVRKNGIGYAGATDKLLRRLFLHTQTATIDKLDETVKQFCMSEVDDIKSSPRGYCILRKRSQIQAKCAE